MLMSFEGFEAATVTQVPDAEGFVIGRAEQILSAGMEHQASYPIIVTRQSEQTQAGRHVPHLLIITEMRRF